MVLVIPDYFFGTRNEFFPLMVAPLFSGGLFLH